MAVKKQIEIHITEKYYDSVPRPNKYERKALKESMMIDGQKDPIVINSEGVVLDGHTRFEICQELKLKPKYRIEHFENKDQEYRYVIESNTNRRQLNSFQKVELFYKIYETYRREAEENHKNSYLRNFIANPKGGSTKRFAHLIGVGEKTTHAALKIIEYGDAKLKDRLRKNLITVNEAYYKLQYQDAMKNRKQPKSKRYPSTTTLLNFLKNRQQEHDYVMNLIQEFWDKKYGSDEYK